MALIKTYYHQTLYIYSSKRYVCSHVAKF